MRANILLKHISIEGFLFHSLRLLFLSLNFSQLTNSLACICQLHKIRTSHCLALYSLQNRHFWGDSQKCWEAAGNPITLLQHPPSPSSAAEQCHWADTCTREQHKKNSARGSFLKSSNFFFPHEKSLTMSF